MTAIKAPPTHWQKLQSLEWPPNSGNAAGIMWQHKLVPDLRVIRSKSKMSDGSEWLHVSVARPDRLPNWVEVRKVKDEFIGDSLEAYHIIPKPEDYVNVHSYCIHLWAPLGLTKLPNLQALEFEEAI